MMLLVRQEMKPDVQNYCGEKAVGIQKVNSPGVCLLNSLGNCIVHKSMI